MGYSAYVFRDYCPREGMNGAHSKRCYVVDRYTGPGASCRRGIRCSRLLLNRLVKSHLIEAVNQPSSNHSLNTLGPMCNAFSIYLLDAPSLSLSLSFDGHSALLSCLLPTIFSPSGFCYSKPFPPLFHLPPYLPSLVLMTDQLTDLDIPIHS